MRELDPGHVYALRCLDGVDDFRLHFVKRLGVNYPGNEAPAFAGPTTQEVLRALIARTFYVDSQQPDLSNTAVIAFLRAALLELEERAARKRGDTLNVSGHIENEPTCPVCGHIQCSKHVEKPIERP